MCVPELLGDFKKRYLEESGTSKDNSDASQDRVSRITEDTGINPHSPQVGYIPQF